MDPNTIHAQATTAADALLDAAHLDPGDLLIVGCSTSEVLGQRIGSAGSQEVAAALFDALLASAQRHGVALAIQCCEHLNRAVVIERSVAKARGYTIVSVVPHPHAGGSLGAHAFRHLPDAVVVEGVCAQAGIDIGDTLIGMHLQRVAVPYRCDVRRIGEANLVMATTRPPLIGGERARYA